MLDSAAKKLDSDLANQPIRKAKLQKNLGRTYLALGLYDPAIIQLQKSRDAFRKAIGPLLRQTLNAARDMHSLYSSVGRLAEALQLREGLHMDEFAGPEDIYAITLPEVRMRRSLMRD